MRIYVPIRAVITASFAAVMTAGLIAAPSQQTATIVTVTAGTATTGIGAVLTR